MKKFLIISFLALMVTAPASACLSIATRNYYLFSVFRREMMENDLFRPEIDKYWNTYTNGKVDQYHWNEEEIMDIAKGKNDTEMVSYLTQLAKYMEICEQLHETWDYPTKEQLAQRRIDINTMRTKAQAYKGSRLKPQWVLLHMRANMLQGQHQANITLWEKTAKNLPKSVFRDMMYNIYAGALLNQGRRTEACEIFAEQGDMVSIKWAMRKHRNIAGIKAIFAENPNSQTMNFLVQDFVNNAQETLDTDADQWYVEEHLDRRIVMRNDVDNFISYANNVVDNGKTTSPAMWMAAVGELQWLYGKYSDAMTSLNKAMNMAGTERMRDNARAIRLVASVRASKLDEEYSQWVTNEIKWLQSKMREESGETLTEDNMYLASCNHYAEVLTRLVYNELVPAYTAIGRKDLATAMLYMMEGNGVYVGSPDPRLSPDNYSSEYFVALDEMTAEEQIAHMKYLKAQGGDALDKFVKSYCNYNEDFYNDLIGTTYLSMGQFTDGAEWLSKVPLSFLQNQAIADYAAVRDYTKPRWLGKQVFDENANTTLSTNKKLAFCNEMNQLLNQYTVANNTTRAQIAYDLATRYYQASYKGDCWWLTRYGQSVYDTARVDRTDFVVKAINYLEESAKSNEFTLHLNSLYGLAYIPNDPWCDMYWDYEKKNFIASEIKEDSRQYKALYNLNNYVKSSNKPMPEYVRKCDILRVFRQSI